VVGGARSWSRLRTGREVLEVQLLRRLRDQVPPRNDSPVDHQELVWAIAHPDSRKVAIGEPRGDGHLPVWHVSVPRYAGDDWVVHEAIDRIFAVPKQHSTGAIHADIAAGRHQDRARRVRREGPSETVVLCRPHDLYATARDTAHEPTSAQRVGDDGRQRKTSRAPSRVPAEGKNAI